MMWILGLLAVGENVFTLPSAPLRANGSVYKSVHADEYVYASLYASYARDHADFDKETSVILAQLSKEHEEEKRVYLTNLEAVENRYGIEASDERKRLGARPNFMLSQQQQHDRRYNRQASSSRIPTNPIELSRYYDAFRTALDSLGPPPKTPKLDLYPYPLLMWFRDDANITAFMARHTARVDAWKSGSTNWYYEVFGASIAGRHVSRLETVRTHITRVFSRWEGVVSHRPLLPSLSFFCRVYDTMYGGEIK